MKRELMIEFLKNIDDEYVWHISHPEEGPFLEAEVATSKGVISNNTLWSGCGISGPLRLSNEEHAEITKAISEDSAEGFEEDEIFLVENGGKPNIEYFRWSPEFFPDYCDVLIEGWEAATDDYLGEVTQYVDVTPWAELDSEDLEIWLERIIQIQVGWKPWDL